MVHGIINTIYKTILSWVENLAEDCEMSIALLKTKIQTLSVPPPLPIQGCLMTVALCVSQTLSVPPPLPSRGRHDLTISHSTVNSCFRGNLKLI